MFRGGRRKLQIMAEKEEYGIRNPAPSRSLAWLGFCIWAILYDFKMGKKEPRVDRHCGFSFSVIFERFSLSLFFFCLLALAKILVYAKRKL